MDKKIVNTENAPAAVGTYSQGVCVGNTYYFSGQIGLDPKTMNMREGFDAQLTQVMNNIDAVLTAENLTRDNIVKSTVFLQDLADFGKVNAAYETFFKAPYPARSAVQVAALPKGALVEIEVIATK